MLTLYKAISLTKNLQNILKFLELDKIRWLLIQ